MSVNSVGVGQAVGLSGWRASVREARQDFQQLFQSLQKGNLSDAQQAYANFQQVQANLAASGAAQSSKDAASSPVAADWTALGQALQSGSLSSAQDAFGKLQQDAHTAWQSQLQQRALNAESVYALMQGQGIQGAAAAPVGAASSGGSVQNDLTALNQALQSGDTASAQKLLAQLEQDLQASGQSYGTYHHHHHQGGAFGMNGASAYAAAIQVAAPAPAAAASTAATGATATA